MEQQMTLTEIYESVFELIKEAKNPNILATLNLTLAKADFENDNHRTYPKKVLKKATEDFNKEIKKQNVTGILANLDHAQGAYPELSKGSHLITKLWMDGDLMKGTAKILNTSKGRDVMTILKSGVKPGISIKGVGNIDKKGFIKDDGTYKLMSADIVNKPSFGDITKITSANLFESVNNMIKEKEEKFDVSIQEFNDEVDRQIKHQFSISFPDVNFNEAPVRKAFEEYTEKNWEQISERVEKVYKKSGKIIEKSPLEKERETAQGEVYTSEERMYDEALEAGYDRDFDTFKSEILPAIKQPEEENLRMEFDEYRQSGGLRNFEEFKKLKEEK